MSLGLLLTMAATFVGGTAFGVAFGEVFAVLHDTIKEVVGKVHNFKPILENLESMLNNLAPMVDEIRQLSEQLDLPEVQTKKLMKHMEELVEQLFQSRLLHQT